MARDPYFIGLLICVALSIFFPIFVFFNRTLRFATWAKIASILVCIFGLGWAYYGWKLRYVFVADMNYDPCRDYEIRGLLGGICAGLVFSVLIAKPYVKRAGR
jgi:hypothetical protein